MSQKHINVSILPTQGRCAGPACSYQSALPTQAVCERFPGRMRAHLWLPSIHREPREELYPVAPSFQFQFALIKNLLLMSVRAKVNHGTNSLTFITASQFTFVTRVSSSDQSTPSLVRSLSNPPWQPPDLASLTSQFENLSSQPWSCQFPNSSVPPFLV